MDNLEEELNCSLIILKSNILFWRTLEPQIPGVLIRIEVHKICVLE